MQVRAVAIKETGHLLARREKKNVEEPLIAIQFASLAVFAVVEFLSLLLHATFADGNVSKTIAQYVLGVLQQNCIVVGWFATACVAKGHATLGILGVANGYSINICKCQECLGFLYTRRRVGIDSIGQFGIHGIRIDSQISFNLGFGVSIEFGSSDSKVYQW